MAPSLGIENLPSYREEEGSEQLENKLFPIFHTQFDLRKIKAVRILIFRPSFPPKIPQCFHTAVQLFPQVTTSFPQVTASFPQV
ncbi:MAG: hypothetical protein F6K41_24720 [Symploca sp. SIO3E6]|nr:hypothetical protein [Caldora sp. SIO3E6]